MTLAAMTLPWLIPTIIISALSVAWFLVIVVEHWNWSKSQRAVRERDPYVDPEADRETRRRQADDRDQLARQRVADGTAGCLDRARVVFPDGSRSPKDCACQQKHIGYDGCCVHSPNGCCCSLYPSRATIEDVSARLDEIVEVLRARG